MTDIDKIVLGALFGVGVYVVGQLLSKFLIEPLHELRKVVGEVRFNLAFYAPTIHTPIGRTAEKSEAARSALIKNSCDLIAKLHTIPNYERTRFLAFGALPQKESVERAAVQLRGLSTYMHETADNANASMEVINKRVAAIMRLLYLKVIPGESDA